MEKVEKEKKKGRRGKNGMRKSTIPKDVSRGKRVGSLPQRERAGANWEGGGQTKEGLEKEKEEVLNVRKRMGGLL